MREYLLTFEDYKKLEHERLRFQAKNQEEAVQTATRFIFKECSKNDFKVFYIRSWLHEDKTVFDYGSHSEFYYLKGID